MGVGGECIILTFAWRVSWSRFTFSTFWQFSIFSAAYFHAEHLNSLDVPVMKLFVSAPLAILGMQEQGAETLKALLAFATCH